MSINSDANGIHEATHGYQIYSGGPIKDKDRLNAEVPAYQRQFSFDPKSVKNNVPSDWGSIGVRSDITPNWVMGIHDSNGNYTYMQGVKPKVVRELIKTLKNPK